MINIKKLRRDIILKGKHSKAFKQLGKEKGRTDAKYTDLNNTDESGAITENDAMYLYDLVKKYKPKIILEIGTWFGTSAAIMAQGMIDTGISGHIFTCDKHDLYMPRKPYASMIHFKNCKSDKFIPKLKIKIDMAFIDARMRKGDAKQIIKLFKGKIIIAVHDRGWEKGALNVKEFKHCHKFKSYINDNTLITLLVEK